NNVRDLQRFSGSARVVARSETSRSAKDKRVFRPTRRLNELDQYEQFCNQPTPCCRRIKSPARSTGGPDFRVCIATWYCLLPWGGDGICADVSPSSCLNPLAAERHTVSCLTTRADAMVVGVPPRGIPGSHGCGTELWCADCLDPWLVCKQ